MFRQLARDCYHMAKHRIHTALQRKVPVYVPVYQSELLKGKTALVTGGTSGIGRAIAEAFLQNGASRVLITGRTQERVDKACAEIREKLSGKGQVCPVVMDNRLLGENRGGYNCIEQLLNDEPLDILVNNAGVIRGGAFGTVTMEEYDAVLETNLRGAYFLAQHVAEYMKQHHTEGNILNIASSSSLRPAISPYTISKWGIRGLTLGLAKTLTPYGIVVNGLAPGPTATPLLLGQDTQHLENAQTPNGRYAAPEEIANMAVILTSALGRTILGDIVYMTCGSGVLTYDDMRY